MADFCKILDTLIYDTYFGDLKIQAETLQKDSGKFFSDNEVSLDEFLQIVDLNRDGNFDFDDIAHLKNNPTKESAYKALFSISDIGQKAYLYLTDLETYLEKKQSLYFSQDTCSILENDLGFILALAEKKPEKFEEVYALASTINKTNFIKNFFVKHSERLPTIPKNFLKDSDFTFALLQVSPETITRVDSTVITKEFLLDLLPIQPKIFLYLESRWRDDPELALLYLKNRGAWKNIDKTLRENQDFLDQAVCINYFVYEDLPENLKKKYLKEHLALAKETGLPTSNLDLSYITTKEEIQELITINPEVILLCDPKFKQDFDLVVLALKKNPHIYDSLDQNMQNDPKILQLIAQEAPDVLRYSLPDSIAKDRSWIEFLITINGKILFAYNVPPKFKKDTSLILLAMLTYPEAYLHLPEAQKRDPQIICEILKKNPLLIHQIPEDLKNNREFWMIAVKNNINIYGQLPEFLKNDPEFFYELICTNGLILKFADETTKKNPKIIEQALQQNGLALFYAPNDFRKNPEMVKLAVQNNPKSIQYALPPACNETSIIEMALAKDPSVYRVMNPATHMTPELLKHILQHEGVALDLTKIELQKLSHNFNKLTDYPERFATLDTLVQCFLTNHTNDFGLTDDRPIAIVIHCKSDYNEAFVDRNGTKMLANLDEYRVAYYEVSNVYKAKTALRKLKKQTGKENQIVWIAGHGTPNSIELDHKDSFFIFQKSNKIDIQDFKSGALSDLNEYIAENGALILHSCSAGSGGQNAENLANSAASALDESIKVYTSRIPSNIGSLSLKNGYPDIDWYNNMPYVIHGSLQN